MTVDGKSESEFTARQIVVRVGALAAWLGIGLFVSNVLGDLIRLSEEPMPLSPASLTFLMFVLSSVALALFWFARPTHRVPGSSRAIALKRQLVETTTDDVAVGTLHNEVIR